MRLVRTAIIAGVASLALAGAAIAAHDKGKVMLVALPDGSVEHIHYSGDAPPQVVLVGAPTGMLEAAFSPASALAEMERISAAMESHAQAMMRQAAIMASQLPAADGQDIMMTSTAGLPVGVIHYSYVSSTSGADGCTRTVRITSDGSGKDARVVRTSAGDCGAAGTGASPAITSAIRPLTPVTTGPAVQPPSGITAASTPSALPALTSSKSI